MLKEIFKSQEGEGEVKDPEAPAEEEKVEGTEGEEVVVPEDDGGSL